MELDERLVNIKRRRDLAQFVNAMAEDLREHPDSWENPSLDRFLDALAAYIDSVDRAYANTGRAFSESQPWMLFAEFLLAAKSYE
jgi:hypothetical protein